jgi:hypothetical protein
MLSIELALIFVYLCVLLIKSCDLSSVSEAYRNIEGFAEAICVTYGFGSTADGESAFEHLRGRPAHSTAQPGEVSAASPGCRRLSIFHLLWDCAVPPATRHRSLKACGRGIHPEDTAAGSRALHLPLDDLAQDNDTQAPLSQ